MRACGGYYVRGAIVSVRKNAETLTHLPSEYSASAAIDPAQPAVLQKRARLHCAHGNPAEIQKNPMLGQIQQSHTDIAGKHLLWCHGHRDHGHSVRVRLTAVAVGFNDAKELYLGTAGAGVRDRCCG